MNLFYEKGIRGAVSYKSKRNIKVTIKFNRYLTLYGSKKNQRNVLTTWKNIISKSLQTSGFKRLDAAKRNLEKYEDNSSRHFNSEIDLGYLKELKKLRNDYYVAPDKLEIKIKSVVWLSIKSC